MPLFSLSVWEQRYWHRLNIWVWLRRIWSERNDERCRMSFISRVLPDRKTEQRGGRRALYSKLILCSRIYRAHTFQVDTTGSQHFTLITHTSESCFNWQPWTNAVVHVRLQVDRAEKLTVYSVAKWLAPPPAVHCCTTLNALFVSVAVFINISLHAFWKYIGSPEMVFAFFNNRISAQLQNDTDTLYKTWRNSICSCKNVDVKHQQINWTPLFSSSASSSSATWHHHIFAA